MVKSVKNKACQTAVSPHLKLKNLQAKVFNFNFLVFSFIVSLPLLNCIHNAICLNTDTNAKKENRKSVIPSIFTKSPKNKKVKAEEPLSGEEKDSVMADTLNSKLWGDCLDVCEKQGKKVNIHNIMS